MSTYRVNSLNTNASRPICRFFVNGYCNRGSNCRYLHKQENRNRSSHSNNSGGGARYNNSNGESSSSTLNKSNSNSTHHRYNKSTPEEVSICRYFLENRCLFGTSCWYKHEKPGSDTNETNETSSNSSQKNEM